MPEHSCTLVFRIFSVNQLINLLVASKSLMLAHFTLILPLMKLIEVYIIRSASNDHIRLGINPNIPEANH